ncbi:MAG: mechanosensitive ion channel family protein, partial [Marinomonas sp.]
MTWETAQTYLGLGDSNMHWIVRVFIVVLLTLIVNFIAVRVLSRIEHHLGKTKNPWDNVLIQATQKPIGVFIWLVGLSVAAEISGTELDPKFASLISAVREVGIITLLAWFVLRFIKGAETTLTTSEKIASKVDYTT